jgi:hypothetical protein
MTSTIERLDTDVRIPYDEEALRSGDPARLAGYLLELVKTLQELLEQITVVSNYNIDAFDGEALYLATKDANGEYPDNAWRLIIVSNALEIQKKISGTWTKIAKHNN